MAGRINSYKNSRKKKRSLRLEGFPLVFQKRRFYFCFLIVSGFFAVGLMLLFFIFLYRWTLFHPIWRLREIDIQGNSRISYEEVLQLTNMQPGQSSLSLHLSDIQRILEKQPWVQYVVVKRILPDTLRIEMQEREAFFWILKDKKLYYADKEGGIIASVDKSKFVSLPTLYKENDVSNEVVKEFAELVHTRNFPFGWHQITWLRFWSSDLLEIAFMHNRKCLMETKNLREASLQLSQVWQYLQAKQKTGEVKKVVVIPDRVWVEF